MPEGNAKAAEELENMRQGWGRDPRLGCELSAHRDLGFCGYCIPQGLHGEVIGWRLLAMAERGVAPQPGRLDA